MATRAFSWMTVVVGDPLYRPFSAWLQLDEKKSARGRSPWEQYHEFALKNVKAYPADYFSLARKAASRADNGAMIEDLGLMKKEAGEFDGAVSCLRQARTIYKGHGDLLRTALEQADTLVETGRKDEAFDLIKGLLQATPEGSAAVLLRKAADAIYPPPQTPAPSPSVSPR